MKCRNIRITCRTDCRKKGERKDEKMICKSVGIPSGLAFLKN